MSTPQSVEIVELPFETVKAVLLFATEHDVASRSVDKNLARNFLHETIFPEMKTRLKKAKALAAKGEYRDLLAELVRLSVEDEANALCWAAQETWLASAMKDQLPPAEVRGHYENLFLAATDHPKLRRRIACELMWNALPGGAEAVHPDASANASQATRIAAEAEGIETQEAFTLWLNTHLQGDRKESGDAIRKAIVDIVGDRWVFDRSRF